MKRIERMMWLAKIWKDRRGQDLIEYALMAGFVAGNEGWRSGSNPDRWASGEALETSRGIWGDPSIRCFLIRSNGLRVARTKKAEKNH